MECGASDVGAHCGSLAVISPQQASRKQRRRKIIFPLFEIRAKRGRLGNSSGAREERKAQISFEQKRFSKCRTRWKRTTSNYLEWKISMALFECRNSSFRNFLFHRKSLDVEKLFRFSQLLPQLKFHIKSQESCEWERETGETLLIILLCSFIVRDFTVRRKKRFQWSRKIVVSLGRCWRIFRRNKPERRARINCQVDVERERERVRE